MGFEEENARVPVRAEALCLVFHAVRHSDLVHARLDNTVSPALEGVADVDHHLGQSVVAPRQHGSKRSGPAAVLELEPADRVLEEQGDNAEVGVRPGALDLTLGELLEVRLGIVVKADLARGGDAALNERALGDAQTNLHNAHERDAHILELGEAALHEALEACKLLLCGPLVRVAVVPWWAGIEVFLREKVSGLRRVYPNFLPSFLSSHHVQRQGIRTRASLSSSHEVWPLRLSFLSLEVCSAPT